MHPIHPMVVHFPIGLLSVSVLFDLLSVRWRTDDLKAASFYTLIAGVAGALGALVTGGLAEDAVEHRGAAESFVEMHETLGSVAFWLFAGLLLLRVAEWMHWIDEQRVLRIAIGLGAVVALFEIGRAHV